MRVRLVLLLAPVLVSVVASAPRAEDVPEYALRYQPAVGRKSDYVLRLEGNLKEEGKEPVRFLASYLLRVEIVPGKTPEETVGQRVYFGPGRVEIAGRSRALRFGGADYIIDRDRAGRGTYVSRRIPELPSANEYFAIAFHDIAFCPVLPAEPVAVDEEWTTALDEEPVLFAAESREEGERTYGATYTSRLTSVREVAGLQLGEIAVRSESKSTSPNGEAEARSHVSVTFDLATGWLLQADGAVDDLILRPAQRAALEFKSVNVSIRPYIAPPKPAEDPAAGPGAEPGSGTEAEPS